MTYERLGGLGGQASSLSLEDLSIPHAVRKGAHDAVSDLVKYAAVAAAGGMLAAALFGVSLRDIGRRIRKAMRV